MLRVAVVVLALVCACKRTREAEHQARPVEPVGDAGPRDAPVSAKAWPQLARLPIIPPLRTVLLPSRPDQPRFDVVGPVILGEIAVVGSSQLGFAGVDWRRGALAWTKTAGSRIAPPVLFGADILLIGDCVGAPQVPDPDQLLACMRTVTVAGVDQAYIAIHGKAAAVDEFSHSAGEQHVSVDGDRVRWQRGDHVVSIEVISGVAVPAAITPPLDEKDRHWDLEHWTGVPGIAIVAHAISPAGDVALAVRLDKTLKHDVIAGYTASAVLRWVYPLPETARVDPIGVAIDRDVVVVFHDGDTVSVLPVRGPSENATP